MKNLKYILLCGLVFLTGCGKEKETKVVEKPAKVVTIEQAQNREMNQIFRTDAIFEPKEKVNHQVDRGGTIEKILKKNGDKVKAGELVMVFSDGNTQASFYSAKANYNSTKAGLDIARNNYNKYKKLYNEKLISYLEYINYENAYINATGAFESAKANYESARLDYDKLYRKAEISGVVGNLFGKVGNKIGATDTVFTVVNSRYVDTYVGFPAEWLNQIEEGLEVQVQIPDANKDFVGKITEINPIADTTTKKFKVKVTVDNSENLIKDGMYGYVTIPAGKSSTLAVPDEAIFVRDLLSYVFKVENGVAKKIEVKTGATNLPYTQIFSDEIKAGDKIVVKGVFGLEDGDKVEEVNTTEVK